MKRLQQLIDTNEFEFLKTMSEEDIWKFAFAVLYVFAEREERTGHWINKDFRKEEFVLAGKCSVCGQVRVIDKFCSCCGAKMVEPQGRSDKE